MTDPFTIVAALAWSALWVNIAVIPFYFKRERLHQDFVASGQLDAALSFIDSERITPSLVSIYQTAIDSQDDKRRKADLGALLTQVDVLHDLAELDKASNSKRQLNDSLSRLQDASGHIWKVGIAHALFMVATPALANDALNEWGIAGTWVCATLAIVSFILLISQLMRFHSKMAAFTNLLRANRA